MIIIISPAKRLDFSGISKNKNFTMPYFINEASELVNELKKLSKVELQKLLNINPDITELNYQRFLEWNIPFTKKNAKEAILAYQGDVYQKIEAETFNDEDFNYAQNHFLILSGLFGVLKPLDLIQPYRLEMATKLKIKNAKNLYEFWGNKITQFVNKQIVDGKNKTLINLASKEYFKAINTKEIKVNIITPIFKDYKNGQYKTLFMYAKQARGMMCNFIIKNKQNKVEDLKLFDSAGYHYDDNLSDNLNWVFTR